MIQGLHKVIQKLILPQYPWIIGYEINSHFEDVSELIEVTYYPNSDKTGFFSITEEYIEVEDLTESLFKMLNFDRKFRFYGVRFQSSHQNFG